MPKARPLAAARCHKKHPRSWWLAMQRPRVRWRLALMFPEGSHQPAIVQQQISIEPQAGAVNGA